MENKTENYIILKPISERFNEIAKSITDEEIRSLIKSELRNQIKKYDFGATINAICESWVEDNETTIINLLKQQLVEKFR